MQKPVEQRRGERRVIVEDLSPFLEWPACCYSNQSFGAWGEVFGDRVIATAILDRVLHHAITVNIRGNSYRLKEKLKAGLIRAEEPAVAAN